MVSPTKVGYIVLATDREGLERKFEVKNRKRNKPAVVLCGSVDQVAELAQLIAKELWEKDRTLLFASSANPSGKGSRGLVSGIGEQIESGADLVIEADDDVRSIQPEATLETRYEQGVMVSFVDDDGALVPEQHGQRDVTPAPVLIRPDCPCRRSCRTSRISSSAGTSATGTTTKPGLNPGAASVFPALGVLFGVGVWWYFRRLAQVPQ